MSDDTQSTRSPVRTAKIAVGAALLVLLTLFVVFNTDDVPVSFVFGSEKQVPLIVVLIVTAAVGALLAELFRVRRNRG